jgi:hypothetical protein
MRSPNLLLAVDRFTHHSQGIALVSWPWEGHVDIKTPELDRIPRKEAAGQRLGVRIQPGRYHRGNQKEPVFTAAGSVSAAAGEGVLSRLGLRLRRALPRRRTARAFSSGLEQTIWRRPYSVAIDQLK